MNHNGSENVWGNWECYSHCPECDREEGRVCDICGQPETWGHSADCPAHPNNHPENCPKWNRNGQGCEGCRNNGNCGRQEADQQLNGDNWICWPNGTVEPIVAWGPGNLATIGMRNWDKTPTGKTRKIVVKQARRIAFHDEGNGKLRAEDLGPRIGEWRVAR